MKKKRRISGCQMIAISELFLNFSTFSRRKKNGNGNGYANKMLSALHALCYQIKLSYV